MIPRNLRGIVLSNEPTGSRNEIQGGHRLLGPITDNRQGRPLRSFDIAIKCIRSTGTKKV